MALIYNTTMSPTKMEMLEAWLPSQPWFQGDVSKLTSVGSYRFDDPDGEVGMEAHLLTAGDGAVYHVPLTYRGAPIEEDGDAYLLDTSAHGVLGTRWISDAAGDPVYRAALAEAVARGGGDVEEIIVEANGDRYARQASVRVRGSGNPNEIAPDLHGATAENVGSRTRIENDFAVLDLIRVIEPGLESRADQLALYGQLPDRAEQVILALLYSA